MATGGFDHNFSALNNGKMDEFYSGIGDEKLGEGSYGQVFVSKSKISNEQRAIKSIEKKTVKDPKRFEAEVQIQAQLDHPNIVKVFEWFVDRNTYYIIMEMCTGGELFDCIVDNVERHDGTHAFDEGVCAKYMLQILGAISYLHARCIAHRDIKPENFLLQNKDPGSNLKVIDFGLARQFKPGEMTLKTKAGTPYYVAPEVLGSGKSDKPALYNEKCDIWSIGVLNYIMICGYPPFFGDKDSQILAMVRKGEVDFPDPEWDSVDKGCKDFILQMLTKDVEKRPSADMCKDNPWLQKARDSKKQVPLSKDLGNKLKSFASKNKFRKLALTIIVKQMKEEDLASMQAEFKALGKNNDGTLTIQEIKEGMSRQHLTFDEKSLALIDTDGSGTIDYTEFLAACIGTRTKWKKELLETAFRTLDKDNNGSISAQELQEFLKDEKEALKLIAECDLNKDGLIQFSEFQAMMEGKGDTRLAM